MLLRRFPMLLMVLVVVACGSSSTTATVSPSEPTASAPASTAAIASSPPSVALTPPAGPNCCFLVGAYSAGINFAQQKSGLSYVAAGCASNPPCLTNAVETDGENAAYVGMDAIGYGGGSRCYAYVYEFGGGWDLYDVLCGSKPDFSPIYGDYVPVRVSGGCANIRQGPGLQSAVVACVPNGTQVRITATPSYADGKMWWGVQAQGKPSGMMSQEFLEG